VPRDLKLSGKTESFTATVTFETRDLFGPVEGQWKISVTEK